MAKTEISKILLQDIQGRFLFVKEKESNRWELPGGKIKNDESRFQAAQRELEEETALKLEDTEDLVRIELEDEKTVNCYVLYSGSFKEEISLGEELSGYKWLKKEDLTSLEWHRDSAYNIPSVKYFEDYLSSERNYGSGRKISVVKALIQNEKGKFLAVKKSDIEKISSGQKFKKYGNMSGRWELPGGRIGKKKGEDRFEAAQRELKEEIGIKVSNGIDIVREEIEEENVVDVFIVLFRSDDWIGEITLSEEHSELKWVSAEEYLNLDWHKDAGYGYSPMKFLKSYLDLEIDYSESE